jgi:dihydrolipoamide dehydrogenase
MIEIKNGVIKPTCDGIEFLMRKNKIDIFRGLGALMKKTIRLGQFKHKKALKI